LQSPKNICPAKRTGIKWYSDGRDATTHLREICDYLGQSSDKASSRLSNEGTTWPSPTTVKERWIVDVSGTTIRIAVLRR
jgi:hypothetical protein